jgi:quercetin dioxygenase-like cupin family protein
MQMQNTQRTSNAEQTKILEHPPQSSSIDLNSEIGSLHREEDWRIKGIARKALIRYSDFRLTLIAMKRATRIEEHHNPGRISVNSVAGHIRMRAGEQAFDLPNGRVLVLDRAVRHDVEALEDSAFLLTVALPEGQPSH